MTKVESPSILTCSIGSIWTATKRDMIAPRVLSVDLLTEVLDQPRDMMALAVIVGDLEEALQRHARGAEIAKPSLDQTGFAIERRVLRCDQQHALQHRCGLVEIALLDQADLEVVLEPQQDVAVADRRIMLRLQLGLLAGGSFQLAAEIGGGARLAASEGIENHRAPGIVQPD